MAMKPDLSHSHLLFICRRRRRRYKFIPMILACNTLNEIICFLFVLFHLYQDLFRYIDVYISIVSLVIPLSFYLPYIYWILFIYIYNSLSIVVVLSFKWNTFWFLSSIHFMVHFLFFGSFIPQVGSSQTGSIVCFMFNT